MLKPGTILKGKYLICEELAHSRMSDVYAAQSEGKNYVVKVHHHPEGVAVIEPEVLKKAVHQGIPDFVDVFSDAEGYVLVMSRIEGVTLEQIFQEMGRQPEALVMDWGRQLCEILDYLHTCIKPVIHCDVNPANILMKPDGGLVLIDFGIAETAGTKYTGYGTVGYAAPEQYIAQSTVDVRTDIFGWGMTMFVLLTGSKTFDAKLLTSVCTNEFAGIITKCVQTSPEMRYCSCAELMSDLVLCGTKHHGLLHKLFARKSHAAQPVSSVHPPIPSEQCVKPEKRVTEKLLYDSNVRIAVIEPETKFRVIESLSYKSSTETIPFGASDDTVYMDSS